uniref:Sigma-70 family RNA polymerase sigma factor n=1 Tax=Roseihalotalea indica TaxID=2867963 RepID=A0AA49JGY7_9BACT|nr:sigma-70 family RNA polymerase sigma factor [Tunicatimonas sp. TK19036]
MATYSKSPPVAVNHHRDAQLWQRMKQGDEQALSLIFDDHIRLLYSYGHKFTANREVVEDCIQDLFAEIWEKRARLSDTDAIRFYLFKGLRRRILRCLEKEPLEASLKVPTWEVYAESDNLITFSQEDKIVSQQRAEEQTQYLDAAFRSLTRRQKEAIYLKFYNRFSYQEIAEVMSLNKRTVYNLISQAISVLQEKLKPARSVLFSLWWLILSYVLFL